MSLKCAWFGRFVCCMIVIFKFTDCFLLFQTMVTVKSIKLPFAWWDVKGERTCEQSSSSSNQPKFDSNECLVVVVPVQHPVMRDWTSGVRDMTNDERVSAEDVILAHRQLCSSHGRGGFIYGLLQIDSEKKSFAEGFKYWHNSPKYDVGSVILKSVKFSTPVYWPFDCPRSKRSFSTDEWLWVLRNDFLKDAIAKFLDRGGKKEGSGDSFL